MKKKNAFFFPLHTILELKIVSAIFADERFRLIMLTSDLPQITPPESKGRLLGSISSSNRPVQRHVQSGMTRTLRRRGRGRGEIKRERALGLVLEVTRALVTSDTREETAERRQESKKWERDGGLKASFQKRRKEGESEGRAGRRGGSWIVCWGALLLLLWTWWSSSQCSCWLWVAAGVPSSPG